MPTAPTAAAIYCRISRDQRGEGLGVARQEELCRHLAESKAWTVAEVYVDNDISAYSGKPRPAYARMLADLEAGTVDAVVVVDQDRLTRRPSELEDFIVLADRLAVPLANVSGDIDLGTSDGRFRARIMGAVARQESEKKSERLRRQRDQHARQGRAHGGTRRFGYRNARDDAGHATLSVISAEAELIREAAARFLAGESLYSIAHDWNDRRISTVSGRRWLVTSLRVMLTGPHLVALRVHRGEVVGDADWTPILDRATWEQIRVKIGDPRRTRGGRPPVYLLTGFLTCHYCGGRLHHAIRASDGSGRYVCAPSPGAPRCARIAIAAEPAESIVTEAVLDALAVPELFAAIEAHDTDTDALTRRIEAAEGRLEELARHYAAGSMGEREWFAARSTVADQLDSLRSQYPTSTPTGEGLPTDPAALRELWAEATIEERRAILAAVVESVVVKPGTPGRRIVDPERIEIRWAAAG